LIEWPCHSGKTVESWDLPLGVERFKLLNEAKHDIQTCMIAFGERFLANETHNRLRRSVVMIVREPGDASYPAETASEV
jgi:hypothetical protein